MPYGSTAAPWLSFSLLCLAMLAAMTRLKQSEFLAGPQLLVVDIKFDTELCITLAPCYLHA